MYIIKDQQRVSFKTFDGWTVINDDGAIEGLDDVQRFTEGEMKANQLEPPLKWVWFGGYKK